jgi:hypothetical protein
MNIQFGTGVLYGLPNAGNTATNPTPSKFPILQEAAVDFKGDLKKLYGQSQFPVAKARGKIEVSGKAKIAAFDPMQLNQLYFGQTATTGVVIMAVDEAGTIPGTPYQITVTNSAQFVTDYGVIDTATGKQLEKVSSAPATGQYSVAAGVYTFAAADTTKTVKISYTYTAASQGKTITLANQLQGFAPELRLFLFSNFRTKILGIELYSVTLGAINIASKQEDFWMGDITFDAGVDATDVLGKIYADVA